MKNINTKIILMTTVLSAILLQSCSSLNEAAGKFNRAILDPISKKIDDACGNSAIICSPERYKELGYFSIHDFQLGKPIWYKPKSADSFFTMCESDRYGCGQKHYEFHPNWELRGKTYVNLSYGKKHKKQMKELARHEDNYNQVIQIGTKICKVDEGYTNEAGFTERFVKDTDKIQIRLLSNNHLIWDDALNWYACN
ncbi:hypothetical protein [uncultured Gammaproteobacteria bacterium]|nr:hypothetical protein [uncultured Gammaproteobacteria bacterium]